MRPAIRHQHLLSTLLPSARDRLGRFDARSRHRRRTVAFGFHRFGVVRCGVTRTCDCPEAPVPGDRSTMREGVGHSAASNAADVDRGESPAGSQSVDETQRRSIWASHCARRTTANSSPVSSESILSGLIDTLAHRPPTSPGTCLSPSRSNSTGSVSRPRGGDGPPGRHFEPARRRDCTDGRTGLPEQDDRGQPRDQLLDRLDAPTPDVRQVRSRFLCGPGRVGARGEACLRRTPCPQALTCALTDLDRTTP